MHARVSMFPRAHQCSAPLDPGSAQHGSEPGLCSATTEFRSPFSSPFAFAVRFDVHRSTFGCSRSRSRIRAT
jgi:hypothetical protein